MKNAPILFDVPIQLSPRLAWIRKHHVKTQRCRLDDGDPPFWVAYVPGTQDNPEACGEGATEDDAIADYARRRRDPSGFNVGRE